jgi:2-methylcitrate dehydratase PrpD
VRQNEAPGASAMLAAFVAGASWTDVESQCHEAKRAILNFFATALGSAYDPAVTSALRAVSMFGSAATSAIIGRPERLDPLAASFVNAISANLLDFDDTHMETIIHPAAPVAAPCGVFGAAAACAKLLGLPADGIANAIGIAASQSAGLVENLPSAAKNVSVGNAARNGLFAAFLAELGYEAAPHAIEGRLGWAQAMGDVPDMARMLGGLGESFELARNTYKPYPAGIVFHAVIDACFKLRAKLGGNIDDLAAVTVRGSALLLARGDRAVRNGRDARVSIHHCVAAALLIGAAGVEEFSEAAVVRPEIVALRQKVRAELDPALPDGAASVELALLSGSRLSEVVMDAHGSLADPLSDADIEAKLQAGLRLGRADWDGEAVIDAVWRLDALDDISGLMSAPRMNRPTAGTNSTASTDVR